MNPLFLEMEFIVNTHQRVAHRKKAEKFARKLAWKQKEHLDRFVASEPTIDQKEWFQNLTVLYKSITKQFAREIMSSVAKVGWEGKLSV